MRVRRSNSVLTIVRCIGIITGAALLLTGMPLTRGVHAQTQTPAQTQTQTQTPAQTQTQDEPEVKIPAEQLDALVAPIALYPDPLLAQTLAASTYPLEIVQLQQWLE